MPALIAKAFTEHSQPFVWACSDCDMLFSTKHLPSGYPASDLTRINYEFVQHSRRCHPRGVVVTLHSCEQQKAAPSLMESLLGWVRAPRAD